MGCDAEVVTIGRSPWPHEDEGVQHVSMDLLNIDPDSSRVISSLGVDTLVHVAWYTVPGLYWSSIENLRWVAGSLKLIDAFVAGGGKRIIVAGTCAEYDWSHHTLVEGKTPLKPSTVYGQSKASLHQILQTYAGAHGISFSWAHIFFPYGPHEKRGRLLSDLVFNLLDGLEMSVSPGHFFRDYIHIADVAKALTQLALSDVSGPVNIASGLPVLQRDFITKAAEKIGRPDLIKFSRPASLGEPPCLVGCTKRLFEDVGFTPEYNLERGLEQTIAWVKSQRNAPNQ